MLGIQFQIGVGPLRKFSSQSSSLTHVRTASLLNDTIPTKRASITHVIFDMDDLLIETENLYRQVQEVILARYGETFDWSLKVKMMGKKALESAKIFVQETGSSDSLSAEQFMIEREDMLQSLFPTCKLMPGASCLINNLHANGIPICVATGLLLGGRVGPQKILVFEDAPAGVGATKSAGMYAVMVPDPRLDTSYLSAADQVLTSLLDFNPSEWGLPLFEEAAN